MSPATQTHSEKTCMLVKDCMTRHPIMVSPDTSAVEAQKLMVENNVRHLPVVGSGKKLEGLVTRSSFAVGADLLGSLNVWEISRRLAPVSVRQVMLKKREVVTAKPSNTVERIARLMNENKISGLPVLEDGIVVGILTETDLLAALQEMLGLPADGIRVTMRMPDRKGEFTKLMQMLAANNWGVMGIGTYPSPRHKGFYDAVIKIVGVSIEDAREALKDIEDQELIDIRDVV